MPISARSFVTALLKWHHLQRYLAGVIGSLAKAHQLQVFIATHAPVFQQINLWPDGAAPVRSKTRQDSETELRMAGARCAGNQEFGPVPKQRVYLHRGPSDRLYIKHWIKLQCADRMMVAPVENVDYAFSFEGRTALAHFDADSVAFIDMLCINRNLAIVFDHDNDFARDAQGQLGDVNTTSAKYRVIA